MTLHKLVSQFPKIDHQIIQLVSKRMSLAGRVGRLKKKAGLPIRNLRREQDTLRRIRSQARIHKVDPLLAERIIKILIKASRDVQHHA